MQSPDKRVIRLSFAGRLGLHSIQVRQPVSGFSDFVTRRTAPFAKACLPLESPNLLSTLLGYQKNSVEEKQKRKQKSDLFFFVQPFVNLDPIHEWMPKYGARDTFEYIQNRI